MASTKEPNIEGPEPERKLQDAVEAEINEMLRHEQSLLDFFLMPKFGLDLAVFMKWATRSTVRFLEHGVVKESRKIGATTLYVTNMDSPVMKRLNALSLEIADQLNKPIIEKEGEILKGSSTNQGEASKKGKLGKHLHVERLFLGSLNDRKCY